MVAPTRAGCEEGPESVRRVAGPSGRCPVSFAVVTDDDPTPRRARPAPTGPVQYRGADLEPERGPGLGCFRFQLIVLTILIVLTPLSVALGWPPEISAVLLFVVLILLLVAGQTIIFLLRLVAADRRSRRRPLGSATKTVGELEDERIAESGASSDPDASSDPEALVEIDRTDIPPASR